MAAEVASILPTPPDSPLSPYRKSADSQVPTEASARETSFPQSGIEPSSRSLPISDLVVEPSAISSSTQPRIIEPVSLPAINTTFRTIAELKDLLQINHGQCGAQTLSNKPCTRTISKDRMRLLNIHLASMESMSCASPDFDSALLDLVNILHCYQHDAGRPKELRIQAWRFAYRAQAPLEQRIEQALGPFTTQCVAGDSGRKCNNRIGGQKVQNFKMTVQELTKQEIYSEEAQLVLLLEVLEWNRTCSCHESSKHFVHTEAWRQNLIGVLPKPILGHPRDITSSEALILSRAGTKAPTLTVSSATEKNDSVSGQINGLTSSPISIELTTNPTPDPALYWPRAYDLSAFEILPENGPLIKVDAEIKRRLEPQDLKDGYLYAYEVDGNDGYVKIGYTTRSVTRRLDDWSFDCNRRVKLLYPPQAAPAADNILSSASAAITPGEEKPLIISSVRIPHARRVEALCHAELNHCRIRIYCKSCLKQHIEWFKVPAADVTVIIDKWSRWIRTRPYEARNLRSTPGWMLKSSELQRMLKLEQFMRELGVGPATPNGEGVEKVFAP